MHMAPVSTTTKWIEKTINSCAYGVWADEFNKNWDSKIIVTYLK